MAAAADPFVEYDKVAARFRTWRSGLPGALDRWGQAVQPFLPARPVTVGDVGAGTGAFSRAWAGWADATVMGIEPSAAMLGSALSAGVPPRCVFVRGVAEALPVVSGTLDIAWISTAFHHFSDRQRAAYELRRALVDDGVVMLRGVLPDRASEGWWSVFPGHERAMLRFPSLHELEGVFNTAGFALAASTEVVEGELTYGELADWVEAMRDADSILTALSDAEIEAGNSRNAHTVLINHRPQVGPGRVQVVSGPALQIAWQGLRSRECRAEHERYRVGTLLFLARGSSNLWGRSQPPCGLGLYRDSGRAELAPEGRG